MDMLERTAVSNVSSERRHSYRFFFYSSLNGTCSKFVCQQIFEVEGIITLEI